jgi:hypothetical protein
MLTVFLLLYACKECVARGAECVYAHDCESVHLPAHITFFIFSNGNFLLRGLLDDCTDI